MCGHLSLSLCCCWCWCLASSRWNLQNFRPPSRSCLAEFPLGKWRWLSRCIPKTHCKSPYCGPRISFTQEMHISSKLETQGQKVSQEYTTPIVKKGLECFFSNLSNLITPHYRSPFVVKLHPT